MEPIAKELREARLGRANVLAVDPSCIVTNSVVAKVGGVGWVGGIGGWHSDQQCGGKGGWRGHAFVRESRSKDQYHCCPSFNTTGAHSFPKPLAKAHVQGWPTPYNSAVYSQGKHTT
eukprot:1160739-Pelagomonas_calceolata.AAC.14